MKEQVISFKTAKLAKEKGFDLPCNTYYDNEYLQKKLLEIDSQYINWNSTSKSCISAPTQSLLQKWLREKHGINVQSNTEMTLMWSYTIESLHPNASYIGNFIRIPEVWSIYEEALERGLQEALKLI